MNYKERPRVNAADWAGGIPATSRDSWKNRRISAKEWARKELAEHLPGKASDYIDHISTLKPGEKVVLFCRVSHYTQNRNGNLDNQEAELRKIAQTLHLEVVDCIRHVGSSKAPFTSGIIDAAESAEYYGAVILTLSVDRFVRASDFHSVHNPNVLPTKRNFDELRIWTRKVRLVSVIHPDAPPSEARSYHAKIGQEQKKNKGGRPRKDTHEARNKSKQAVLQLYNSEGFGISEIKRWLGKNGCLVVSRQTMYNWIRAHQMSVQLYFLLALSIVKLGSM